MSSQLKQPKELEPLSDENISISLKNLTTNDKRRTKYSILMKVVKTIAAILLPLAIGAFTVVQTLQESSNAQLQRDVDYQNRLAEQSKINIEQQRADAKAIELRIQNVYDKFVTELQPILRIPNANLTESDLIFIRAKTFATLEQIDSKRKSYLIKFLYDSQLLFRNDQSFKVNYQTVDLDGADLSNCQFGPNNEIDLLKLINWKRIRLFGVRLRNSSFQNMDLTNSIFEYCDLTETNFINTNLTNVYFQNAIVDNSNFINTQFHTEKMDKSSFKNSIFSKSVISTANKIWKNCDFTNSIFKNITFMDFQIKDSIFDRVKFIDILSVDPLIISNVQMQDSSFKNLQSFPFRYRTIFNASSDFHGTTFQYVTFGDIVFDNVNLEQCQISNLTLKGTAKFNRVNMLNANLQFIDNLNRVSVIDSVLPNGSFITLFPFGMNLLKNGDAEQECDQYNVKKSIRGWENRNNVIQMFYNFTGMEYLDDNSGENQCLFFGGKRYVQLYHNYIVQVIDVSNLTRLFNLGQTTFVSSALLGGIDSIEDAAYVQIMFYNKTSFIEEITIGPVTNDERQNKTSMILKTIDGKIPKETTEIRFFLRFIQKDYHADKNVLAMGDNLKFIIK